MLTHACAVPIEIDEAAFRWRGITGRRVPQLDQRRWNGRPWRSGFGMRGRIAIAGVVGIPAERSEIRFLHRERRIRFRHARLVERRLSHTREYIVEQCLLCCAVEPLPPQRHTWRDSEFHFGTRGFHGSHMPLNEPGYSDRA